MNINDIICKLKVSVKINCGMSHVLLENIDSYGGKKNISLYLKKMVNQK